MSENVKKILFIGVVIFLLWSVTKVGPSPVPSPVPPPVVVVVKPTAATYVYEKDSNPVPSPVLVALNTLNRSGLIATVFEQDTQDGTGDTPEQYKVPLAAAKTAGLPALVVTAGNEVIRVVKDPKTAAQVTEAAKP